MKLVVILLTGVWLYWTAPGDDGNVGRATRYEMRLSASQLTAESFSNNRQIGTPDPSPAGSQDSVYVDNLTEGYLYYVRLRTVDDAGNWSALSNQVQIMVPDTTAPASVNDLRESR